MCNLQKKDKGAEEALHSRSKLVNLVRGALIYILKSQLLFPPTQESACCSCSLPVPVRGLRVAKRCKRPRNSTIVFGCSDHLHFCYGAMAMAMAMATAIAMAMATAIATATTIFCW